METLNGHFNCFYSKYFNLGEQIFDNINQKCASFNSMSSPD